MLKPLEEMTSDDYAELGLKAGLEIHQQLKTKKKLFCRCPAGLYSEKYDAEILRHMRPTLSELGEYDGTALMEFKTKKEIIYQLNKATVCTYEMDDAPPFELNEEALEIALEITLLLKCKVVSELHIARKQYLDGSIPTGFQRTTILGIDGEIPYKNRKIGITQLGLEEDACREVKDEGHFRVYKTDRLGMPLIEVVTDPQMRTPQEVAEVAQVIRLLTRATGRVNRGIGAARQDVNVSIEGGTRIEIKGVSRIPLIPLLVHNEAGRQKALLDIRHIIRSRGATPENFKAEVFDVTDIVKNTIYLPIKNATEKDTLIKCVKLPYFGGLLRYKTQPGTNFAKEISDRVRVIGCLHTIPNIIHSDTEDETISSARWQKIKRLSKFKNRDALVIVWGNEQDVETAVREITIRAEEAIVGIPQETRQALPDGTTGFERILPGPDRMYPDTDLPPIALTDAQIYAIQEKLPALPWERQKRYLKLGLEKYVIDKMLLTNRADIFDKIISELAISPKFTSEVLIEKFTHLKRKGLDVEKLTDEVILKVFEALNSKKIVRSAICLILQKWLSSKSNSINKLISKFEIIEDEKVKMLIPQLADISQIKKINDSDKQHRFLMGIVMDNLRGKAEGQIVSGLVKDYLVDSAKL
ncbi:glutamyl-tRNA(Gln) amidotransferase subunit E [candidate division KSB1 bacterium 4572_119]|nr:MAG: glutamyl-tRNA(Gln) amidotransferase subunit E [candidate division KSB1 bacterium 4572_119]